MGAIYAWASPGFMLDEMSLDQILLYYQKGIKAEENKAAIYLGVLEAALKGEGLDPKEARKTFREMHPEAIEEGGTWRTSE